jgi:hypothetical protein
MTRDLTTLTPQELAAERETARRDLLRGMSEGLERFADVVSESARRSARMSPTWADRIGHVDDPAESVCGCPHNRLSFGSSDESRR